MNAMTDMGGELDAASFKAIASLAYEVSGLTLVEEKKSMIRSRLRHRLRALDLPDFKAYTGFLSSEAGHAERAHLISALTTNVSHFFREPHHFDVLKDTFKSRLPALRSGSSFRIWSAGCSNGQEAVSAAITLMEAVPDLDKLDVKILATDIDTEVVRFARAGVYPERLMGGVSPELRRKYFTSTADGADETMWEVSPAIKRLIRINPLNLLGRWPMSKPFDAIFCRNVVIYFDLQTQESLWPRYRKALGEDGLFLLGHSERIQDPERFGFKCTGPTIYQPAAS